LNKNGYGDGLERWAGRLLTQPQTQCIKAVQQSIAISPTS